MSITDFSTEAKKIVISKDILIISCASPRSHNNAL